ncbi:fimbrial protein, partial [Enterobacter hormaechei]|nr:fimbrial protein [Enterobacter hormaechei]
MSGRADVTLQAYPISTTGQSPELGVFRALALLRIDFA